MPDAFAVSGLEIFCDRLRSLRADEETDKPYFSGSSSMADGRIAPCS
jgi:hypothetical protein